ncbi:MAG: hypothetical protein U0Y10_04250 [Spirosomataceae bacterium]
MNTRPFSCSLKTFYPYVLLLLSAIVWSACSSDSEKTTANLAATNQPNVCTVVFMDKSLSVNVNKTFINEKYRRILSEAIDQDIQHKGDRIEVYFIHENTAKAKAFEGVCHSEMEDLTNVNGTDAEAIKTAYELSLKKERMAFRQRTLAQLAIQNSSASNQATDIWASLSVINQLAGDGFIVKAYYLTDMIESMKGDGRRDFQVNPPKNDTQAEEWAKADAEKLKESLPNLSGVEVKLALPFEPTSTVKQNNPTVTKYWEVLLTELGVSSLKEVF